VLVEVPTSAEVTDYEDFTGRTMGQELGEGCISGATQEPHGTLNLDALRDRCYKHSELCRQIA
jgi:hypothetical protein